MNKHTILDRAREYHMRLASQHEFAMLMLRLGVRMHVGPLPDPVVAKQVRRSH